MHTSSLSNTLERRKALHSFLGVSPALLAIALFLLVPILIVIGYSLMQANPYGGVDPVFSSDAYTALLFERQLDDSLAFADSYLIIALRSIGIAGLTTVITLLIGFPVAVWLAMQPPQRRGLLIFLITVPFWANLLIRTYAWILLLRSSGVINNSLMGLGVIHEPLQMLYTDGAVLLGLVYTYAPFVVLPIYATLEKMDTRLLEAAQDLYAGRIRTLRKVVLPLAKPGILAGAILTFVPCLGAMIAPELLGGGTKMMLGNLIFRQFSDARNWPFGAALSLVLMAAVMLVLTLYALRAQRQRVAQGGV
ncbi:MULTISPECIES: ABC transporter permease [Pseudomonas]|uniref:Spermidine/putrescine import ABC transporter permease protein PotB n=1 Tax=Pseudomonas chlororaphis TaxID=587753 RepID=A0A3G7TVE0_9PSED|nr:MULTISPECIES: ABC transporter permease [Pseudomonas]AZD24440.1 Spermidine/putrescine import ABC transporter permease protein PotB [Pseudomonas chlororaphis subsp. aurantiaca]AZD50730.1 Spermidine/putrescine import ABC transporter permease protein PotB [Pseudomonas chlororaphis subsp. aurantiaca]AZD56991.1 Spermidine/putrescine import ABC transporter permease protein PotB [Pseudomonas chlororaphis subsp. aurantiaca]AZE51095.1 Spermidine/putrescine import ABC transporter permease protein PotB 